MDENPLNFARIVPEWINQSFFDRVIQHMQKDPQAKALEFDIVPGSTPGDNFGSAIYRASIKFSSKFTKSGPKTISIIIKAQMPAEIPWEFSDFLRDSPLFQTEMGMYGEVLPEIKSLWLAVGDKELLCPDLIYQSIEPEPVLVMEDVSGQGFGVIAKPGNLKLTKKIFRRLGKFHASSFYLNQEKKMDFGHLGVCILKTPKLVEVNFTSSLEAFIGVSKEWEGFEKFIPSLETFKGSFLSKGLKTFEENPSGFGYNVLNHADLSCRNMLFRKAADGEVEDFYFIDFQISSFATPAIDMFYALYCSTTAEIRLKHRAELIAIYHEQFVESLNKFGYLKEPPSLIDLQIELLRNGHFEVLIAVCYSIYYFVDLSVLTSDAMDMGEGTKNSKWKMYQTPGFKEIMLAELQRFLYNGSI